MSLEITPKPAPASSPKPKRRSSRAALRCRRLAACVVLPNESLRLFKTLMDQHLKRFEPADDIELALVEELVTILWRQRRAWVIESSSLGDLMEAHQSPALASRLSGAFAQLVSRGREFPLVQQNQSRLHLSYQQVLRTLRTLQADRQTPRKPSAKAA